jgi:hypothetical protein
MYVRTTDTEEMEKLARSSGEVRGAALLTDVEYVRRYFGGEMLQRIEFITRELGYHIEYKAIKATEWYPVILRPVSLFAIRKALDWDDERLRKMGRSAPQYSIITQFMIRYFSSVEELAEKLRTYWRHNYSTGSLRGMVIDRSAFVCLSDFSLPPILSTYLEGYFVGVLGMVIGKNEWITVRKTERWHTDNECNDFILRW